MFRIVAAISLPRPVLRMAFIEIDAFGRENPRWSARIGRSNAMVRADRDLHEDAPDKSLGIRALSEVSFNRELRDQSAL
jgi:hypothetical protein